jgi:hypothetical protein
MLFFDFTSTSPQRNAQAFFFSPTLSSSFGRQLFRRERYATFWMVEGRYQLDL